MSEVVVTISFEVPIGGVKYQIELRGPKLSVESRIEELRSMIIKWAMTWLKYPGFEIFVRNE